MLLIKKINKKLGISDIEVPAVYTSWFLRFFYQIGLVVSWTILIALFVNNYGIGNLLFLFLIEAILYGCGTVVASFLLSKLHLRDFIFYAIGGSVFFLLLSLMFTPSETLFFVFVILAKGLFFSQLNIALSRRTETLFSTEKAQKFMPIIETAIVLGAIVGAGAMLFFLAIVPTEFVLILWLLSLIGIAYIVKMTPRFLHFIPHCKTHVRKKFHNSLKEAVSGIKKISFLKYLMIFLVLQSLIFTVTEVEFVRDLQGNIATHNEVHLERISSEYLEASVFNDFKKSVVEISSTVNAKITNVSSKLIMNESLAHDLGMFHLLFALIALIVQIAITPRVIKLLGVVGSMISYAVVLFFSVGYFLFGYLPIGVLRMIQHGTHSIGEASYHLSYYSIFHHNREAIRIFLEGIIRPLGMVMAIVFMFMIPHEFIFYAVFMAVVLMLVFGSKMRQSFTELSKENLVSNQNIEGKMSSIEVLGQHGHKGANEALQEELLKKDSSPIIREKIIKTLSGLNNPKVVHTYIQILRNENENIEIKRKVLDSLFQIEIPFDYWKNHAFTRYHFLEILKSYFRECEDKHIKKLIVMNMFKHLPNYEVVPFFLKIMKNADDDLKSVYLRSCSMFDDPEIVFYVKDYLKHDKPKIKSHAIIALWKFQDKEMLRKILNDLITIDDESSNVAALYTFGEVGDEKSLDIVRAFVESESVELRLHALIALAKLGDERCIQGLLEYLFCDDFNLSKKTFYMMQRVPENIRVLIQKEIQHKVAQKVANILKKGEMEDARENLGHLYWIAGRYDDLLALNAEGGE